MKYTVKSLINELKKFPEDLLIDTSLSMTYKFNDSCYEFKELHDDLTDEDFEDYCKFNATDLAIFEGEWENDGISDLNNIMPKYVDGWYRENIFISKEEYDKLIQNQK